MLCVATWVGTNCLVCTWSWGLVNSSTAYADYELVRLAWLQRLVTSAASALRLLCLCRTFRLGSLVISPSGSSASVNTAPSASTTSTREDGGRASSPLPSVWAPAVESLEPRHLQRPNQLGVTFSSIDVLSAHIHTSLSHLHVDSSGFLPATAVRLFVNCKHPASARLYRLQHAATICDALRATVLDTWPRHPDVAHRSAPGIWHCSRAATSQPHYGQSLASFWSSFSFQRHVSLLQLRQLSIRRNLLTFGPAGSTICARLSCNNSNCINFVSANSNTWCLFCARAQCAQDLLGSALRVNPGKPRHLVWRAQYCWPVAILCGVSPLSQSGLVTPTCDVSDAG